MISSEVFYRSLVSAGVNFVTGVPDSLLKEFCSFAGASLGSRSHFIAANEGAAVAIAAGVQLATGGIPLVYLQNSGLGNAVNPLLSLADPEVYGIPMVLLIGWRGEPDVTDEPQHLKQGRVTPQMLASMEIPFQILDADSASPSDIALSSVSSARQRCGPTVILVRKNTFERVEADRVPTSSIASNIIREEAIELLTSALPRGTTIVSTTGHISRELYEQRVRNREGHSTDFLTVGSMGHASQIALGIAMARRKQLVVVLDGDGAALMHMGGLASIGASGVTNFMHIVLNNGVHDSVGGQPTVGLDIDFTSIARACGYREVQGPILDVEEISSTVSDMAQIKGPCFLELQVVPGARPDLGRPLESPADNKAEFESQLRRDLAL